MGVHVALVGRNSRCKTNFLRAAASSENSIAETALETTVWWTSKFAPRQADDLAQAPAHGFSPDGERLLQAQLTQVTAADIALDGGSESTPSAVLLVVPAGLVFYKGQPKLCAGFPSPVKAVVGRFKDRLGSSSRIPIAVAVSVDTEDVAVVPSPAKAFLELVTEELAADNIPVVAVSPRTELWLREQECEGGRVSYQRGQSSFRVRLTNISCIALR